MPFINEAVYALRDGVAEPDAIDTVAKLGFAHPMGPLALADLIGLDTCVAIMEVLVRGLGDEKYAPCPLLRRARPGRPPRPQVGTRLLHVRVSRQRDAAASSAARSLSARRVAENTSSPSEYAAVKSAAPFTSSTVQPPPGVGRRSTPTRSPPSALGRGDASSSASRGGDHRDATGAERDVRPPLAGLRMA